MIIQTGCLRLYRKNNRLQRNGWEFAASGSRNGLQELTHRHPPDQIQGPGQEGAEGDAVLGDLPEAQEVHLRAGLLPEDAENQEIQLQCDKTGRRVGIAERVVFVVGRRGIV